VYGYAFNGCSSLESISIPKCNIVGTYAFAGCINLKSINIPECSTISSYAFNSCVALETVILSSTSTAKISYGAFKGCVKLISLYLLASRMITTTTDAFNSTPLSGYSSVAGQLGKIYVPSSLYDSYIANTTWKKFSSIIESYTGG
jgi:hypothetical protein